MKNDSVVKIFNSVFELRSTVPGEIVPQAAQQHFRSSRKEFLLGAKAMWDQLSNESDSRTSGRDGDNDRRSQRINITE